MRDSLVIWIRVDSGERWCALAEGETTHIADSQMSARDSEKYMKVFQNALAKHKSGGPAYTGCGKSGVAQRFPALRLLFIFSSPALVAEFMIRLFCSLL